MAGRVAEQDKVTKPETKPDTPAQFQSRDTPVPVTKSKGTKTVAKGKAASDKPKATAKSKGRPARNAPFLLRCMLKELKASGSDSVTFFGDRFSAVSRNIHSYIGDIGTMPDALEEEEGT